MGARQARGTTSDGVAACGDERGRKGVGGRGLPAAEAAALRERLANLTLGRARARRWPSVRPRGCSTPPWKLQSRTYPPGASARPPAVAAMQPVAASWIGFPFQPGQCTACQQGNWGEHRTALTAYRWLVCKQLAPIAVARGCSVSAQCSAELLVRAQLVRVSDLAQTSQALHPQLHSRCNCTTPRDRDQGRLIVQAQSHFDLKETTAAAAVTRPPAKTEAQAAAAAMAAK
jgi:hypothetical protein